MNVAAHFLPPQRAALDKNLRGRIEKLGVSLEVVAQLGWQREGAGVAEVVVGKHERHWGRVRVVEVVITEGRGRVEDFMWATA